MTNPTVTMDEAIAHFADSDPGCALSCCDEGYTKIKTLRFDGASNCFIVAYTPEPYTQQQVIYEGGSLKDAIAVYNDLELT